MEHAIHVREGLVQVVRAPDVALHEPGLGRDVLAAAHREVVEDGDLEPAAQERCDEVVADESGSPGDQSATERRTGHRRTRFNGNR